ncbi:hypothetical protein V6N11_024676 [Hibiscus sabdariffa]|uniref:Endonuclease/exonuclease/phosphatase domain-containing protein n=1 Tax=Hibiscus sabdariffa TaxID=183260 RepID=A0ABR2QMU7_9ROSI
MVSIEMSWASCKVFNGQGFSSLHFRPRLMTKGGGEISAFALLSEFYFGAYVCSSKVMKFFRAAKDTQITILKDGKHFIDTKISINGEAEWLGTFIYGPPHRDEKQQFWEVMTNLRSGSDNSWLVIGDTNVVTNQDEKLGGAPFNPNDARFFYDFVDSTGLLELPISGGAYTWSNQRSDEESILEKLDRAMCSLEWSSSYPKAIGLLDVAIGSDHASILILPQGLKKKYKKEFKFESKWLLEEECTSTVQKSWASISQRRNSHRFGMLSCYGLCGNHVMDLSLKACWSRPGIVGCMEPGGRKRKGNENNHSKLQEKDNQKDRMCMELVDKIKLAEVSAANHSRELQSSKTLVYDLEKELETMRQEQTSLQQRVKELQDVQANIVELQDRVKSFTDLLSSKDQEIEALTQALDEEEVQIEELTKKIEELEKVLQQKNTDIENLEASRGKAVKKLSITMSKFDELRALSESLITQVEQLQSQLQDRDAEISFLRQEVTRCTNDVLAASQIGNKKDSDEINEFLIWIESIVPRVGSPDLHFDTKDYKEPEYREIIHKRISSMVSEVEDLRGIAKNRDELLQAERSKVEELTHKEDLA